VVLFLLNNHKTLIIIIHHCTLLYSYITITLIKSQNRLIYIGLVVADSPRHVYICVKLYYCIEALHHADY